MKKEKISQPDMLDILFEGRNKDYGAYALRRSYKNRMYRSLTGTILACLLFVVASIFANTRKPVMPGPLPVTDVILANAEDKKRINIKPLQPRPIPKPQVAMTRLSIPKIVADKEVKQEDELPPTDVLDEIKIGPENRTGDITDVIESPVNETTTKIELKANEKDYDSETYIVQVEAQFPGGLNAWTKFLERNLNADIPVDNGATAGRYSVQVSFLVDKHGNISEVMALNDPGFGAAEEAVRVIKKSKQWIPAIQNGRAVIYRQKQVIVFEVTEN